MELRTPLTVLRFVIFQGNMKKLYNKFICASLLLCASSVYAQSNTIAPRLDYILSGLKNFVDVYGVVSYVLGALLAVQCAIKLKEHAEHKGQVKFITPVMYFIGASILLTFPSAVGAIYNSFGGLDGSNHSGGKDSFKDVKGVY